MKILIAPDSFKECLSSFEVADAMEKGFYKASTEFKIKKYPLSDGGDGSFEVISFYKHAKVHNILCYDPLLQRELQLLKWQRQPDWIY